VTKINTTRVLANLANEIRALEQKNALNERDTIKNIIGIGKRLHDASEVVERGKFMDWAASEFPSWSHQTSLNYRDVYELVDGSAEIQTGLESGSLNLTISALYIVAAMKGDDEQDVRMAIIEAAKQRHVTRKMALAIIEEHRQRIEPEPSPAEPEPAIEPEKIPFELIDAYGERFGYVNGMYDSQLYRLMEASLLSGVDEPELVEIKRKLKEHVAEFERKHAEFLATPITAETEQEYTSRIKQRRLYEGACDLSWEQYFKFRDQHPDCEPLTPDDLTYLAMWTPCAAKRPHQDQEAVPPDSPPSEASMDLNDPATALTLGLNSILRNLGRKETWLKIIEATGAVKFREIIAMAQAVYDEHCETSVVKSAADRAETKAERKMH
jgi:hypothetical protein